LHIVRENVSEICIFKGYKPESIRNVFEVLGETQKQQLRLSLLIHS